jgi:mono/diheme cytochrome c family protein
MTRCLALAAAAALALPLLALAEVVPAGELSAAAAPSDQTPAQTSDTSELLRGWTALRAVDCARCHGRHYSGWAAPDLIAAVREGSRERFMRIVLDGEIVRGMPGYRSQAVVRADIDAIYAYLSARADGSIGPGAPAPPQAANKPGR